MALIELRKDPQRIKVLMDGKHIGNVRPCPGGFQYIPKGAKHHAGDVYPTIEQVRKSLEGDD